MGAVRVSTGQLASRGRPTGNVSYVFIVSRLARGSPKAYAIESRALLAAEGSREATLLVRRGNGQFSLARIDARVASAARLATHYALPRLAQIRQAIDFYKILIQPKAPQLPLPLAAPFSTPLNARCPASSSSERHIPSRSPDTVGIADLPP